MGIRWWFGKPKEVIVAPTGTWTPDVALLTAPGRAMHRKKFVQFSRTSLVRTPFKIVEPFTPMCRVVYSDGTTSKWNSYQQTNKRRIVAIETCVYGYEFWPRYAQLKVD